MKFLLLIVAVLLALVVFRILRSSSQSGGGASGGASSAKPKRVSGGRPAGAQSSAGADYRAISVKCGPGACEEALALEKRRFLPGKFRTLPLADCNAADCQCKFVHHPDRRGSDGDQRALGLGSELYSASGKAERRSRRGRRKTDFD